MPLFDRFTGQSGDSHIFIAGDADDDVPLLHEAADEGKIAGDNAGRYPDVRAQRRRAPLGIVFTDPQIATVGRSWRELQADGVDHAIGEVSFEDQGRSRVINRNRGLLRLYGAHGTGLFLGAEMIGPAAEHLGHLLAWAAQQGLSVHEMLAMPYYHPVIEEGVRTALRDLNRQLRMGPSWCPTAWTAAPAAEPGRFVLPPDGAQVRAPDAPRRPRRQFGHRPIGPRCLSRPIPLGASPRRPPSVDGPRNVHRRGPRPAAGCRGPLRVPAAEALPRAKVRRGRTAVTTGWSSGNASLTMGRQRIAVSLVHGILGIRAPAQELAPKSATRIARIAWAA